MKFKCTTAARACYFTLSILCFTKIRKEENTKVIKSERKEKMKEKNMINGKQNMDKKEK